MDPTREPRPAAAEPAASGDLLTDDAVVAYLRARAPGPPIARFDPKAVTAQARRALRRRHRRRRNAVVAASGVAAAYLALALAGPQSVPGLDVLSGPGSAVVRAVGGLIPGGQPEPEPREVDRLEAEVLPVVQRLQLSYYLRQPGPCRLLEYPRGNYLDGDRECGNLVPFDAAAQADFAELTAAIERSGVPVERIYRDGDGIVLQLEDDSWQYNWAYVHLPDRVTPPPTSWPEERWTHVRDDWWFHRAHDD